MAEKARPYVNPAWTSERRVQPNVNLGQNVPELRQMLGSGKIAETFKRGARHYPICPACGLEVAPGDIGEVFKMGNTPYEQILILAGMAEDITYHKECKAPDRKSLLEQVLKV